MCEEEVNLRTHKYRVFHNQYTKIVFCFKAFNIPFTSRQFFLSYFGKKMSGFNFRYCLPNKHRVAYSLNTLIRGNHLCYWHLVFA